MWGSVILASDTIYAGMVMEIGRGADNASRSLPGVKSVFCLLPKPWRYNPGRLLYCPEAIFVP